MMPADKPAKPKRKPYSTSLPPDLAEWLDEESETRMSNPTLFFEKGIRLVKAELEARADIAPPL